MTAKPQTIAKFLTKHFEPERLKDAVRDVRTSFRRALERFATFLDREPSLSDLTAENVDSFDGWLGENGFATRGAGTGRSCLLRIWAHAYFLRLVPNGPYRTRPRKPSRALSLLRKPTVRTGGVLVFIIDWLRQYAIEQGLSVRTINDYRHVLNSFAKFLQRRPRLADLRDDRVNQWIVHMQESGLKPVTVRGRRVAIMVLWRAAVDAELVDRPPGRIRKIRVPAWLPKAWSQTEMRRLLDTAEKQLGHLLNGIPRAALFKAWIMVAYYSGLRRVDLFEIQFSDIRGGGKLFVTQHKTGNIVGCTLPEEALAAIEAIRMPLRRHVFGDAISPNRLCREFSKLVRAAGLTGSTKRLRASGATAVEGAHPGSAMSFLGHKTHGLAFKHYIDPTLLQNEKATPPRIGQVPDDQQH